MDIQVWQDSNIKTRWVLMLQYTASEMEMETWNSLFTDTCTWFDSYLNYTNIKGELACSGRGRLMRGTGTKKTYIRWSFKPECWCVQNDLHENISKCSLTDVYNITKWEYHIRISEVYNMYYKPPTYLTKSVTVKSYAYQKLPFFLWC